MANSTVIAVQITYRGAEAKADAFEISHSMAAAGVNLKSPSEIDQGEARLGAAEIIITLLLTSALKAIAMTSLDQLEGYLRSKIEKSGSEANLQIVLKSTDARQHKRFPISMRQLSNEAITKFFEQIRAAINKL